MTALLDAALTYARRGWSVVPLGPRGKIPTTPRGIHDATTDEETITRWWTDSPDANIGVATGRGNGIVAVDIDGQRGKGAWGGLAKRGVPKTLIEKTGRPEGGAIVIFEAPDRQIPSVDSLFSGLAICGDGAWIVVPPSIHESGAEYKWSVKMAPAPMPDWLLGVIDNPPAAPIPVGAAIEDIPPPPCDDDAPPDVKPLVADAIQPSPPWSDTLLVSQNGTIKTCVSNALKIVHNHSQLRGKIAFNVRRQEAVWCQAPPWRSIDGGEAAVIDEDGTYIAEFLSDMLGIDFGRMTMLDAIVAEARRHPYDPVVQYLTSLQWDGVKRLDGWLVTYFGAVPTKYVVSIGSAWMISAIARAFRPGCQADYMLVLEGLQGAKKSTGLGVLASDEFFAEVSIDPQSKDSTMAMHGPWIVEWGELAGQSKRESEAIKAFLTRRSDRVRKPYGRTTVDLPRRCIIAATTNEDIYLSDSTGNRRYWPVRVIQSARDDLARDRDQLWAEACARFNAGEQWWLDDATEAEAREQQDARSVRDPWEEPVTDIVTGAGSYGSEDFISTAQVLAELKIDYQHQSPSFGRRVAGIMKKLGWSPATRRVGGRPSRGWARPVSQQDLVE